MQLGPSFHQSSLSPGQAAGEQLDRVKPVHGFIIAVVGVKVTGMTRHRPSGRKSNDRGGRSA